MPEELSGWDLARACAERLGVRQISRSRNAGWIGIYPGERLWKRLKAYHESADACLQDLSSLWQKQNLGLNLTAYFDGHDTPTGRYAASLKGVDGRCFAAEGDSVAEALCRVFLVVTERA